MFPKSLIPTQKQQQQIRNKCSQNHTSQSFFFQTTNQKLLLMKIESQNFEVQNNGLANETQKEMLPKSLIPTQKQQQ
jgi:hypothetical protein